MINSTRLTSPPTERRTIIPSYRGNLRLSSHGFRTRPQGLNQSSEESHTYKMRKVTHAGGKRAFPSQNGENGEPAAKKPRFNEDSHSGDESSSGDESYYNVSNVSYPGNSVNEFDTTKSAEKQFNPDDLMVRLRSLEIENEIPQ